MKRVLGKWCLTSNNAILLYIESVIEYLEKRLQKKTVIHCVKRPIYVNEETYENTNFLNSLKAKT